MKKINFLSRCPNILCTVIVFILGLTCCGNARVLREQEILNFNLKLVQEGYLGNYDTVTVKDAIEGGIYSEEGSWSSFFDGDKMIVEYRLEIEDEYTGDIYKIVIQFLVSDNQKDFSVVYITLMGLVPETSVEAKEILDTIYQRYVNAHPESGLIIDTDFSNNTLKGHAGPIREISGTEWK